MKFDDLLRISIRQVLRQRRRNLGVVIAIALGTAGLITVITMGRDVKYSINQDLELLGGATRIRLTFNTHHQGQLVTRPQWFRRNTVDALLELPGVAGASLITARNKFSRPAVGKRQYPVRIVAADEHYWRINSFVPRFGRFFETKDVQGRARVCILGERIAQEIFGRKDVVGRQIPLDNDLYTVVGVLGGVGVADRANWAFVPITTAEDRLQGLSLPNVLYLRCNTWDDVEKVAKAIPAVVRAEQPDAGLRVDVGWEQLKKIKKIAFGIELFVNLAVVATLVLGGFGIWNIMMVSVRSRTREIGLKKAIGAEDRDIMMQFLAEALCLSLGAALIGVVLGRIGVEVVARMLGSRPPEDLFLFCVGLGILFSIILGLGSGLLPSIRASRMEVVTAVRYE